MRCLLLYSLLLIGGYCVAQNLVPNPSFEDTVSCPDGGGQVWKAEHWYVAEQSPDYFNECCTLSALSVPDNLYDTQYAATGFSYCGMMVYSTVDTFYREILGVKMHDVMSIGLRYYVSFKLSATNKYWNGACNKIGLLFSTEKHTTANTTLVNDYCQVWTDSIIIDTSNWISVKGSFIADSSYKYLSIGNFFTNAHTDTLRFWETNALQSYYFIDDICVSVDSIDCFNEPVSITSRLREIQNEFTFYPNPANSQLMIETKSEYGSRIELYNNSGSVFLKQNIPRGSNNLAIDVLDLEPGIYLLKYISDNKAITRKIIIKH